MAAVTICSDFGAPKIKSVTVSTVSPSISQEVMGPDAMIFILAFWLRSSVVSSVKLVKLSFHLFVVPLQKTKSDTVSTVSPSISHEVMVSLLHG